MIAFASAKKVAFSALLSLFVAGDLFTGPSYFISQEQSVLTDSTASNAQSGSTTGLAAQVSALNIRVKSSLKSLSHREAESTQEGPSASFIQIRKGTDSDEADWLCTFSYLNVIPIAAIVFPILSPGKVDKDWTRGCCGCFLVLVICTVALWLGYFLGSRVGCKPLMYILAFIIMICLCLAKYECCGKKRSLLQVIKGCCDPSGASGRAKVPKWGTEAANADMLDP